jgi:hypothetical protein
LADELTILWGSVQGRHEIANAAYRLVPKVKGFSVSFGKMLFGFGKRSGCRLHDTAHPISSAVGIMLVLCRIDNLTLLWPYHVTWAYYLGWPLTPCQAINATKH